MGGSGLKIDSACLMYLNRDYVFDGKEYRLGKLFVTEELDDEIEEHSLEVPQLLAKMRKALSQSSPPDISPGPHCRDPFVCEFFDHCNAPLPVDHVGNLPGLNGMKLNCSTTGLRVFLISRMIFLLTKDNSALARA